MFQYSRYSDDALMEVISDTSPRKSSGSIQCEDVTSSCPCIDNFSNFNNFSSDAIPTNSCPTVTTPLLLPNNNNNINHLYDVST